MSRYYRFKESGTGKQAQRLWKKWEFQSTLRGWLKSKDQLRRFCNHLNKEGYDLVCEASSRQHPHPGSMVQAKAEKTYQQLHQEEDCQSWMDTEIRGASRHQRDQDLWRGKVANVAAEFNPQPHDYIKGNNLELTQIYNCDETALYYKVMTDRTFALRTETQLTPSQRQSNFTL